MDNRTHQAFAVIIGGIGMVFIILLFAGLMMRANSGLLAIPVVGVVLWREMVFAAMRSELDELRKLKNSN